MNSQESSIKIIKHNIEKIEQRVLKACIQASRIRETIQIVYVTKYLSHENFSIIKELAQDIELHIGENRVQTLLERKEKYPENNFNWHLIGHLQTNKISKLPSFSLIHSIDSEKLLLKLDQHYLRQKSKQPVLLQINITGEASKQGFSPKEAEKLFRSSLDLQAIRVVGLMTMAKKSEEAEASRETFRTLKNLFETWKTFKPLWSDLQYLSMGMSQDFEVAIEEGATHLRLGSILFQATNLVR